MNSVSEFNLDFICIGGTKCGTTWLSEVLRTHPELNISENKEPCYFSENYKKGIDWYRRNWREKRGLKGEFSAHYLYKRESLVKIKNDFPKVKIILILRDPLSRAISHFNMLSRSVKYSDSINLKDIDDRIIQRSLYYNNIKLLFELFSKEQIYIDFYDRVLNEKTELIKDISKFLGVSSDYHPKNIESFYGKAYVPKIIFLDKLRQKIHDYLQAKELYRLVSIIKSSGLSRAYKKVLGKSIPQSGHVINLLNTNKNIFIDDLVSLMNTNYKFDKSYIKNWIKNYEQ